MDPVCEWPPFLRRNCFSSKELSDGSVVDLGATHLDGHVLIDNKPGTVRELADEIKSAADERQLSSAHAGKLRSKLGRSCSNSHGKCSKEASTC